MGKEAYLKQVMKVANSSPYYRLLGMRVKDIKGGKSRIEMRFRQDLTHPYGIAHGGAIASLADSAVAMALIDLVDPKDRIATIEFKINFLASVDEGELAAHAKIIHKGSKTAVGDVEVFNESGKLVAKLVATYSIQRNNEKHERPT
jgi:acyl-CoA thioesterase